MLILTLLYLILALVLFNGRISKSLFISLTSLSLFYASILSLNIINIQTVGSGISLYSGLFSVSILNQFGDCFLFFVGSLAIIPWPAHGFINLLNFGNMTSLGSIGIELKKVLKNSGFSENSNNFVPEMKELPLFLIFTSIGGSFLISSADLVALYLSIELQSFGVYLYAAVYREIDSSIYASLKYYLLGGLSSSFILLGCVLIYSYTGLTQFDSIFSLISVTGDYMLYIPYIYNFYVEHLPILSFEDVLFSENSIIIGITLGVIILLCGFLFKVSAAPFHNWAPDVYDGTPTIITTWLTILPKLTIFIFFLQFVSSLFLSFDAFNLNTSQLLLLNVVPMLSFNEDFYISAQDLSGIYFLNDFLKFSLHETLMNGISSHGLNIIQNLILISSLISLILGTVVGLKQDRIKRLLGYSTISHVGFLLLALSLNTESSVHAFIFYILQYTLTNLNVFLILLALGYFSFKSNILVVVTEIWSQISILNKGNFNLINKNEKEMTKIESFINNYKLGGDIELIEDLKGFLIKFPLLSLSMAICLFSMAGIPPLVGFFAKQNILYSSLYSEFYFLTYIAIIVSVISGSYYLKVIKVICFSEDKYTHSYFKNKNIGYGQKFSDYAENLLAVDTNSISIPIEEKLIYKDKNLSMINDLKLKYTLNSLHSFSISFLSIFTLAFIFKSSFLLNSAYLLAESTIFF